MLTLTGVQEDFLWRKGEGQGVQQQVWHRAAHPLPPLPRGFANMDICVCRGDTVWAQDGGRNMQTDGQGRVAGLCPALLSLSETAPCHSCLGHYQRGLWDEHSGWEVGGSAKPRLDAGGVKGSKKKKIEKKTGHSCRQGMGIGMSLV